MRISEFLKLDLLLSDETGFVVSSEAVLVGTVGVLGATAGISAISKSVDAELYEMASAIRNLDQSYSVSGTKMGDSWSAGSSYQQPPVEESLKELELNYRKQLREQEREVREQKRKFRRRDRDE